ncbi:MAG: hypothetical protein DMG25_07460 [Acidobacteria bacterium]|nr:MAG: hypothetical protein DMG25_07460 [Acidobacteriota bacterium]PYV24370.1 MAG: hypothetical protein DMG27_13055 [Acidobacteriota bacterium]
MLCGRRGTRSWANETHHAHIGIEILENALREKDQPDSHADEYNARRTCWSGRAKGRWEKRIVRDFKPRSRL